MKKNNVSILIILTSLILIVAMIGATFAYFTATSNDGTSKVTLESAELGSAMAEGTAVELAVMPADMEQIDGKNDYSKYKEPSTPGTLKLSATNGDAGTTTCTYNIIYKPTTAYIKSTENTLNLKEFTIRGSQNVSIGSGNVAYTGTIDEYDLTGVSTTVTLVSGATMTVTGVNQEGEISWEIVPRFYNLAIDQTSNANISFGGSVEVGSLACVVSGL